MSKTKKKILKVALNLFNEKGLRQVTIRMVAQELQMSSGNLNYHFKRREDILESLYFEMVEEFDNRLNKLPHSEFTFEKIFKDIQFSMTKMVDYIFIWTDLYYILSTNRKINSHFTEVYLKRLNGNLYLFQKLISNGWMEAEGFEGEFDFLANRMVQFGDSWIYASLIHNQSFNELFIEEKAFQMLAILFPYLNEKGKAEFTQFQRNHFN
jgi:AcrR family transcriptional regulator